MVAVKHAVAPDAPHRLRRIGVRADVDRQRYKGAGAYLELAGEFVESSLGGDRCVDRRRHAPSHLVVEVALGVRDHRR